MVVHALQAVASFIARAIAQALDLSRFVVEASVNALRCAKDSLVLSQVPQRRKWFRHDWQDIVRLFFKLLQAKPRKQLAASEAPRSANSSAMTKSRKPSM